MELSTIRSTDLSPAQQKAIVALCSGAFDEDYQPYLDNFGPTTHVLCYEEGRLVSHALWVERWLQPGDLPILRTAYIEGVCTDANCRGRGFASSVMSRIAAEIKDDFDLAGLGTRRSTFYAQHGWERWLGPTLVRTATGTDPHPSEFVMILRLPRTPALETTWPLSCEWRPGDIW